VRCLVIPSGSKLTTRARPWNEERDRRRHEELS
jgi:hypothetical protein